MNPNDDSDTERNEEGVSEMTKTKKTVKKSAKKPVKTKAKTKTGSRNLGISDFIRSQPAEMGAKDVVAAGKKRGLSITPSYVYNVRLQTRKLAAGGKVRMKIGLPALRAKHPSGSTFELRTISATGFKARALELADKFIDDLTDCLMQSIRGA